ncbi:hypothetical protein [Streptomyces fradiae]|uniref:hypothetical protein n=1 Tax=Streptomyces fradiae TaxID=1906 RepID=UPI003516F846
MTEPWPYARPGAPAFGEWLLGRSVSPEYVAAAVRDRMGPYTRSLVPLVPLIAHSVLGGRLMLLGPVQLLSAVRRRIRLHGAFGIGYAAIVYVSMGGAAAYLARTPPEQAFSGAAFWIARATILVGTVFAVTFGVLTAVTGLPELHQRWFPTPVVAGAYAVVVGVLQLRAVRAGRRGSVRAREGEAGGRALRGWLDDPAFVPVEARERGILKLWFGARPGVHAPVQIAEHTGTLEEYEQLAASVGELLTRGQREALEFGIRCERMMVDFWRWVGDRDEDDSTERAQRAADA